MIYRVSIFVFLLFFLVLASPETHSPVAAQTTQTISGTIFEANGTTPIAVDAWVGVLQASNGNYVQGGDANPDGTYTLSVAPGSYRIRAAGTDRAMEFYSNAGPYFDAATTINVAPGQNVTGIDFSLDPGGTISGVVKNNNNVPIANMGVGIADNSNYIGNCTNQNGEYTLYNVPLNVPYKIRAGGDNFCQNGSKNFVEEFWQEKSSWDQANPITLTAGSPNRTGINFTLDPGGTISGRVLDQDTGQPVPFISIGIESPAYGIGRCTDANGYYTIGGIPFNTPVRLAAAQRGNHCGSTEPYVLEYWQEKPDHSSATVITMTSALPNWTNINLTPKKGGTLSGRVTDQTSGNPLENMRIDVNFTNNTWMGTCTDSNGDYSLYVPFNLSFRVSASRSTDGMCNNPTAPPYLREYWQESPTQDGAALLSVTPAAPTQANINMTLVQGGTVTGNIYESNGTTLITSNAWIDFLDSATGNYVNGTGVQSNGSYSIALPPGTYKAYALGTGRAMEFYNNAGPYFDNATPITVTVGNTTSGIHFSLDPGGTISGVVRDRYGVPVPNINVGADPAWLGTCTDQYGQYTLNNVPLGIPHKVAAGLDNNWCGGVNTLVEEWWQESVSDSTATPITVTAGSPNRTGINFTLDPGATITGTVTAAENGSPVADVWLCAFDYSAAAFDLGNMWRCGQTQANGSYSLSKLIAGQKRLWIFPNDRLRLFYNNSTTFAGATPVNVTLGGTTPNINFVLPQATVITGTVTAPGGAPMNGVTISTENGEYMECSQPDGTYRIFVPVGTHIVKASAGVCSSTVKFRTQYYDGAAAVGDADPIVVSAVGQTIPNINFTRQIIDDDGDGVDNEEDVCPGFNDHADADADGIPDACEAPAVPVLTAPTNGSASDNRQPSMVWQAAAGANTYEVRYSLTNPPNTAPIGTAGT
ncbi:MAG: hypothetical protein K8I82_06815, partial [Anaerolineae bacterium]|nr:hypothetical protein [Anaerolineae bacterium]